MTNTIQSISLSKLDIAKSNVRKTGAEEGIDDLIESISAHGLLQSLVVQTGKRGRYAVIAGGRRLRALKALAKSGAIGANYEVPCKVIGEDANAAELSLAENIIRAPMHPADQFEAFCAVIDQGKSIADVAARFNVSEGVVQKRLKLGRLSPVVLQAYREDRIELDQAEAFALSDDPAEQERVLADLGDDADPRRIRAALTHGEVPASDKRVCFIGEDAYTAAGGCVRRDLFDDEDSFYACDEALLEKLVAEKLAALAEAIKAEGWQWVTVDIDADYATLAQFVRLHPGQAKLSRKAQKQLDRLAERYDVLAESVNGDDDAEMSAELHDIERQIEALQPADIWPADTLASCGAIVTLDHCGEASVERGLMRRADARKRHASEQGTSSDEAAAPSPFSAKLVEDLTAHKTAAMRVELARQPDLALATVVHALLLRLWYGNHSRSSCLDLSATSPLLRIDQEDSPVLQALEQSREIWAARLPAGHEDAWRWCLGQTTGMRLALLAYLVANTVDAVQRKQDRADSARLQQADALARQLNFDMKAWFVPTAEDFFSRISRKAILSILDEATGSHGPALEKFGKRDLAERAAQLVQGTGWLPAPLRTNSEAEAAPLPQGAE